MFEERASVFADRVLAVHYLQRRRLSKVGVSSEKIEAVMNTPDPQIFEVSDNCQFNGDFTLVCHTPGERFKPALASVHSTLLRGNTPAIATASYSAVAYSPVLGKHVRMKRDLLC